MPAIFQETLYTGYAQTMTVKGPMLADEQTTYQHIQIFDTESHGRVMALDGIVQITEQDEASYSEMLAHPPLLERDQAKNVLIIGGGDGAVAEEVLKHPGVTVDMCEIDQRVVDLCQQHLACIHKGAFHHLRLRLHIGDAFQFLKDSSRKYDVIIADRPDPIGPAETLFNAEFYRLTHDALTEEGVVVLQNGVPFYQSDELKDALKQLRRFHKNAGVYVTATPSYIGGFMALSWASNGAPLGTADQEAIKRRFADRKLVTDHYNPELHRGAFALPQWIRRLT